MLACLLVSWVLVDLLAFFFYIYISGPTTLQIGLILPSKRILIVIQFDPYTCPDEEKGYSARDLLMRLVEQKICFQMI